MIWLRYVPHGQMLTFLAKGWQIRFYSVLMNYEGEECP